MRPVFGEEIKSAENKETHENDVSAGGEEAPLPAFVTAMIHHGLISDVPLRRLIQLASGTLIRVMLAPASRDPPDEEIVERPEHESDVPAPGEAFRQPEEKAAPAQQFEPRQEDRKRPMLHGKTRRQQIPGNTDQIRNHKKQTEAQSQCRDCNCAGLAGIGLPSQPEAGRAIIRW